MHGRPAQNWTIEESAKQVGLSRWLLAERFTNLVGIPPMQDLTKWRMQIASDLLTERWRHCSDRRRRNRIRIRGGF